MVLLVPSDDQTNLPKLEYHLSKTAEGTERGNTFIDAINNEFKKEFANEFEKKWGRPDVTLTMPMFSIKGSSDVAEILKKVSLQNYARPSILFSFACPDRNPDPHSMVAILVTCYVSYVPLRGRSHNPRSLVQYSAQVTFVTSKWTLPQRCEIMNSENVVAFDFLQLEVNGIFNSGEFGQISDKPLKVGNILHKATIDVNTEGTEAAAATGVFTFLVDITYLNSVLGVSSCQSTGICRIWPT